MIKRLANYLKKHRKARSKTRQLRGEPLEPRMLLDADGVPWAAPNLTISFAPDGTPIAGYESRLFEALGPLAPADQWQSAILQGFTTWTQHVAASASITSDNGEPFGVPGPTQGDPRFGDVRVGAIPMPSDIIAMSVPHDEVISGTWAGDILLNANASLADVTELLAVAIHEAGHVLGLGHSIDPNSPMFQHGVAASIVPTATDIQDLQKLYGVADSSDRDASSSPDSSSESSGSPEEDHDREHSDDVLVTANGLTLQPQFQGALRYQATGQIFDATDVDFYQLTPVAEKLEEADILTVIIRSTSSAGLMPSASILDEQGKPFKTTVIANANGEFIIQASGVDPRQAHFIEVRGANSSGPHATGPYELDAVFGVRKANLDKLLSGKVTAEAPNRTEAMHISKTQLVHFVLEVEPTETTADVAVSAVIYDGAGIPVFRVAARQGDSRSANTVLLTPGDYRMDIEGIQADGPLERQVEYGLLFQSIAVPIGPVVADPTNFPILPCSDPASDPIYCSADATAITDPLILPAPTAIALPTPVIIMPSPWLKSGFWYWDGLIPPSKLPPPLGTASLPPASPGGGTKPAPSPPPGSGGTTGNDGGSTPPTTPKPDPTVPAWHNPNQPSDVNGDQFVTPLDALAVIDYLNSTNPKQLTDPPPTAQYVDVDSDGFATPIDALMVIDQLNTTATSGEGEGAATPAAFVQTVASSNLPAATASASTTVQVPPITPRSLPAQPYGSARSDPSASNPVAVDRATAAYQTPLEEAIGQLANDLVGHQGTLTGTN